MKMFFLWNVTVKCILLSDGTSRIEHSGAKMAIDGLGTEHIMLAV
jgi:hypothetical protein